MSAVPAGRWRLSMSCSGEPNQATGAVRLDDSIASRTQSLSRHPDHCWITQPHLLHMPMVALGLERAASTCQAVGSHNG